MSQHDLITTLLTILIVNPSFNPKSPITSQQNFIGYMRTIFSFIVFAGKSHSDNLSNTLIEKTNLLIHDKFKKYSIKFSYENIMIYEKSIHMVLN